MGRKERTIKISETSASFRAANPGLQDFLVGGNAAPQRPNSCVLPVPGDKTAAPRPAKRQTNAELCVAAMLKRQQAQGEILSFGFEDITLKVGEPECRYTGDFAAFLPDGRIRILEAKGGRIWEDGLVKFKAARKQYPKIEFEMWQIKKDEMKRIL